MGSLEISGPATEHADAHSPSAAEKDLKSAFNERYEIISEVGRGAMGVVYKAHDRVIGRTVALKTILVGRGAPDHDEVIERLKSEAKAAGSLDHPNIVTVYDVGHDGDRVYLSMQFVEGSTLAAMLDGKNLRPGQLTLLSYAEQICNAVAFAHERGVVHRDLKPSNLMLTPQGQIKVLDFGIAKQGDASLTQSGMVVGTPAYMAPEQATGKDVDQRSDIFSLGAVFYELFTGKKAFHADAVTAVLYRVVHDEPEAPMAVNPMVPQGLDAAIRRALEKDANLRFQNCVELRDTLRKEAVLLRTSSAKILAKPLLESGNHKRLMAKGKSRHRLSITLALCFVLAAAGVVVWPQRSKMPRLMHFINYVQQVAGHQRNNEPVSAPPAVTGAAGIVKSSEIAPSQTAGALPVTPDAGSKGQDPTAVSSQTTTALSQPVPAQANDTNENQSAKHEAAEANSPSHTAAIATLPVVAPKEVKSEGDPTATVVDEPSTEAVSGEAANEPTDAAIAPRRARIVVQPAPAMVEGFTRKDISDLLGKADSAAGSGDYKSALYEYGIVLRLDRANARAREGLRRVHEAEKERR
ncbi:MAG TPA: protein kinase [Candidatus Angelobacter sp.]|nr:protein kinase [Candidatus Angelobacter sp.]